MTQTKNSSPLFTTTLPRQHIRDRVVAELKSYIASENLKPGDRLPTELELAKQFGVNRLSLREATKALEFLGIVESKTGVGLIVGEINMSRMTDHLGFHPGLLQSEAHELIDSRIVIEVGVLPYVASRMIHDKTIYVTLQEVVNKMRSVRNLADKIETDIAFHRALLQASGLTPLIAFGDLLQVFFRRFRDSIKHAEWNQALLSHQRIIDLLKSNRVPQATEELQQHIASHRSRI